MRQRILLFLFCSMLPASAGLAQVTLNIGPNLHSGKVGLGLDGISGSPNLLLKYFFTSRFAGEVILGAAIDARGGEAAAGQTKVTGTTLRGGIGLLYHLMEEQVSPYVGVEALVQTDKPAGFYTQVPDAKTTVTAVLVLGGEYFLNERFSFGIKQSLGAEFGLKRDVPRENTDVKFATATFVTGRFYFN
jgi:outer membrane protein W